MTVVIPVANDTRIQQCVESITEAVEILIVLNGASDTVKRMVCGMTKPNLRYIELSDGNLGAALETGIRNATHDKVLLMDSDCIFETGCINKLRAGLEDSLLVKGKIKFKYSNLGTYVVSKVCDFRFGDLRNAFKPPLGIDRHIVDRMEGYYYDKEIHWLEDVEFEERRKRCGVEIKFVDDAVIYHSEKTIWRDLRSAFCYGIGSRIGVSKRLLETNYSIGRTKSIFLSLLCEPLHLLWFLPRRSIEVLHHKGMLAAIYFLLYRFVYRIGYYYQIVSDPYDVK